MNLPCRVGNVTVPLFGSDAGRAVERAALAHSAPNELMELAGLAVARLAMATAPHASRYWVACGPGNNGGDGLVAARWLHQAGKSLHVTWHGDPQRLPADAAHARDAALRAGVVLHPPGPWPDATPAPEVAIDALLGLGQRREPQGLLAAAVDSMNRCGQAGALVMAVDLPTGLCADTGRLLGHACVRASLTLSLLTLKPGTFTADGLDAAGEVWWDDLGCDLGGNEPTAMLTSADDARIAMAPRLRAPHASHKGRFGDVWVVGGAAGMTGAAHLAARASLQAGAGRVYLSTLGAHDESPSGLDTAGPEIMRRTLDTARSSGLADHATVVAGCGGGDAIRRVLPELLSRAPRLVLDADALNAIAADTSLSTLLQARRGRSLPTVLTPHPLEAARLLGVTADVVQSDRLSAARQLAERFNVTVLLKGSGSVITTPGTTPQINSTGNARLSTAGTGDVLAGWLGGAWSGHGPGSPADAAQVAAGAAWLHGKAAQACGKRSGLPLLAGDLIVAMSHAAMSLE